MVTTDETHYCVHCYLELRRVFNDPLRPKGAWADPDGSIGCPNRAPSLGYRQVHQAGPDGWAPAEGSTPPRPRYIPQ